jgi:dipeptidyl aminopeptidase/acylaminoacyl peptidase
VTTTNTTKANDWVSLSVHLLDTATSKVVPVATATAFQPSFSPDGKQLAYTIADESDYVWAQTWHICVVDVAKAMAGQAAQNTKCDTHGTYDQMPTMVGWDASGSSIMYMEQNGTAVELYAMAIDSLPLATSSASPSSYTSGAGWRRVGPLGCATAAEGGVIGGGFRSTSRLSIGHGKAGATLLGYSWESFHSPQQGFISVMSPQGHVSSTAQLTSLSAEAATHTFPSVDIVQWPSDDGLSVEGLLIKPQGWTADKSGGYPLITFTHCGPAMAVLQTFIGYGM